MITQFGLFRKLYTRRKNKKYTKHLQSNFRFRFFKLFGVMCGLILIHTLAMMYFEGMGFGDGLWLSVTTLNTVGYGDFSSSSLGGRISTTIFLYIIGISLLSMLIAEYMEYRMTKRELKNKGQWSWNMNEHILIINTPNSDSNEYLTKLVAEIRRTPELSELPIQIVTRKYPNGLPDEIVAQNVVHCHGKSEDTEVLLKAGVESAKYIFVLARSSSDSISDSLTFDVLNRIYEIGSNATIAVEVVIEDNRERCKKIGATVTVRPIRAYPELLIRGITSPGTEEVLENLFSHQGSHMERIDCVFNERLWKSIVIDFLETKAGLPIAYIDQNGNIVINPHPTEPCKGKGIITMVYEKQSKVDIEIKVKKLLTA